MLKGLLQSLLRLFFHLLYHQFAWTYDWVAAIVSIGRWNDWVMATLPFILGPRVLEIGYGPGHLQVAMRRNGLLPYGVDASWQMSRFACLRLSECCFEPLIINGYAQFISFSSKSFNSVIITFPTRDIFSPASLSEIYRVLKPGGKLAALPSAWIKGTRWCDKLAAWLFRATGQTSDWDESYILPFITANFEVKIELVELNSSQILLILATKPP